MTTACLVAHRPHSCSKPGECLRAAVAAAEAAHDRAIRNAGGLLAVGWPQPEPNT